MFNQFCKFDGMTDYGADLFYWLKTRLNISPNTTKHVNGFVKFLSIQYPVVPKLIAKLRRISKENRQFESKSG